MRKLMLLASAIGFLGIGGFGCSHYAARKGAEYHEAKAERAAARGDYYKAAAQQRKADIDRERAASAPLP